MKRNRCTRPHRELLLRACYLCPMAETKLQGNPVHTVADLPAIGSKAPDFTLVKNDLGELKLSDLAGQTVVLNIFPSIDTWVCASSVRRFNSEAAQLENTTVVGVSMDLPFALGRFCAAEGIDKVITTSAFRSDFGADYGVKLIDGGLAGLLARSIVVIAPDGTVKYTELVPEITTDPNFEAALAAVIHL